MELSNVMDSDQYKHNHSIYREECNFDMDEFRSRLVGIRHEALCLYPPILISYTRALKDNILSDDTSLKNGSGCCVQDDNGFLHHLTVFNLLSSKTKPSKSQIFFIFSSFHSDCNIIKCIITKCFPILIPIP